MRLSRIYASKLYLTSARREQIADAINSSQNAELVQQLSDYLDDKSKEKLAEAIEEQHPAKEEEAPETPEMNLDEDIGGDIPDERNVFSPSYSGGGGGAPGPMPSDDMGGDEPDIFAEPSEGGESGPAPEPANDEPVEESTAIYGEVNASTQLEDAVNTIAEDIEIIKGTLNGREDTSGVIRATLADDELWLYYKDEVNIGDIMVDVIEVLNGTAYTYLTFSRLARSNNAIVFDINLQQPVKSIVEVEEEAK